MPVDTEFIIGSIRFQERHLLEEHEYTRLINAPDGPAALRAFHETFYGQWWQLATGISSAFAALDARLLETMNWLESNLANKKTLSFIQAKYDGLNIASAIIAKHEGRKWPTSLSELGAIEHSLLQQVIWHDNDHTELAEPWRKLIESYQKINLPEIGLWQTKVIHEIAHAVAQIISTSAHTLLQRNLAKVFSDKTALDSWLRGQKNNQLQMLSDGSTLRDDATPANVLAVLHRLNYLTFTEKTIADVCLTVDATAYERMWDEIILTLARRHKADVSGDDGILAFWLALEFEVKTIRLILSAKLQNISADKITPLQRSLFLDQI